jgi:peroxin-5
MMSMRQVQANAWKEAQVETQHQQWANEFNMNKAFEEMKVEEDASRLTKEMEQQRIHEAVDDMYGQMAQDEDPRFHNSKFLGFLSKLKTGELRIEGKELIERNPDNTNLETAWTEAKDSVQKDMNTAWQEGEKDSEQMEKFWADRLREYEEQSHDDKKFQEMLEKQYKQVLEQMNSAENMEGAMGDAWQKAGDVEEYEMYRDVSDKYNFKADNQFLEHESPFQAGLELMAQGRPCDAILAFEAAIQKNPNSPANGNTWRIMGRIHQENDCDQKAVACLLNALKFDEKDLDTLLALGISCTNTLDELKAMNFLKMWLLHNQTYAGAIQIDPMLIPSDQTSNFTTEEIRAMNAQMIDVFERARAFKPDDPELYNALAVLYFISRDYEKGVILFREALKYDPENYSLWNKLGASLAHLGRADEAMEAYHRALDIKPNYVRVWVNLGIAHAFKNEYENAAQFYINALSFNPDALHIWTYLHTAFSCMNRFDLVARIRHHDVNQFADSFDILKIDDLPRPSIDYKQLHNRVVIKETANQWTAEFN